MLDAGNKQASNSNPIFLYTILFVNNIIKTTVQSGKLIYLLRLNYSEQITGRMLLTNRAVIWLFNCACGYNSEPEKYWKEEKNLLQYLPVH